MPVTGRTRTVVVHTAGYAHRIRFNGCLVQHASYCCSIIFYVHITRGNNFMANFVFTTLLINARIIRAHHN